MLGHIIILISCIFVYSNNANAQTQVPLAVKMALKNIFSTAQINDFTEGDLNNDGIDDATLLILDKSSSEIFNQFVILRGKSDGSYDLFAQSIKFPEPLQRPPEFYIKKQSLFIGVFNNTGSSGTTVDYQFKYLKNGFFLIGEEQHSYSPLFDDEVIPEPYDYKTSINYLTGQIIRKNLVKGKTKKLISQQKATERKLLTFEEYDFAF